ncbi:MAG: DUF4402 domain-containing protein [Alphaproteobacteria bacterium]|jgi:hypothetical protein|nr:DUF4402 domain-containing protein [Alphaproteobacteria bacterium]
MVWAAASISLVQTQRLTFPTLAIPSSSSSLTINPLNSATSGTAQIISGTASRGVYDLSMIGGGSVSISLDISVTNAGTSGVTLGAFTGLYQSTTISSFPSSTLPLPSKKPATTPLYLGATLTANSSVAKGSYAGSIDIIIFVQ